MSAADFTRRKLNWLTAIATDRQARGLPLALAVVLACRYFNARTETAWPGIETLARDLDSDRRAVQRAVKQLVDGGWLRRTARGGNGRNSTNVYMLPLELPHVFRRARKGGAATALKDPLGRSRRACKGGLDVPVRAVSEPPEPLYEPGRNPFITADAENRSPLLNESPLKGGKGSSRFSDGAGARLRSNRVQCRRRIPLPENWVVGEFRACGGVGHQSRLDRRRNCCPVRRFPGLAPRPATVFV